MVWVASGDQPGPSTLHGAYSRPTPMHVNGPAHHSSLIDSGSNADGASVQILAKISSLSGEFEYRGRKVAD